MSDSKETKPPFHLAVAEVVRSIPLGSVLSYAEVAMLAGRPGAARAVAGALRSTVGLPWWRVIRSDGGLAPAVALDQERLLREEGVEFQRGKVARKHRLRARAYLLQ